jgi:hypothetical protein
MKPVSVRCLETFGYKACSHAILGELRRNGHDSVWDGVGIDRGLGVVGGFESGACFGKPFAERSCNLRWRPRDSGEWKGAAS